MVISTQKKTLHLIHTWRKQSLDIRSVVKVVSFSKNKHECSFLYLPPISVLQPSIKIQQMYTEICSKYRENLKEMKTRGNFTLYNRVSPTEISFRRETTARRQQHRYKEHTSNEFNN